MPLRCDPSPHASYGRAASEADSSERLLGLHHTDQLGRRSVSGPLVG